MNKIVFLLTSYLDESKKLKFKNFWKVSDVIEFELNKEKGKFNLFIIFVATKKEEEINEIMRIYFLFHSNKNNKIKNKPKIAFFEVVKKVK